MPNNIFVVTLTVENTEIEERIKEAYRYYPLSDKCYLVSSDGISEQVANQIGLKGNERIPDALGVVFKLNGAYSGYASKSIWEWLSDQEEQS